MFPYIHFGHSPHGLWAKKQISSLESGRDGLVNVRDVLVQMRDGNGSEASHYAEATARFSFPSDEKAKEAYEEIASACFALEQAEAALNQLFAKTRGA